MEDGAVDRWGGDWGEVYWCGHTYYTYMTCWSKAGRPFRERKSSSSLYLAVVTICWTRNPIVKGENFLFFTLITGWVFFDCSWGNEFAGNLCQYSREQTTKMKPADHAYFGRDEFTSCKSLIYWSLKPPKLSLCNNSSPTKKKIENCQFRHVKPQLHHLIAWEELE